MREGMQSDCQVVPRSAGLVPANDISPVVAAGPVA
jgi:hypothetical protein